MDFESMVLGLERSGYRKTHETKKVAEFSTSNGRILYAIKGGRRMHLVLDRQAAKNIPQGIMLGERGIYHNSNMLRFEVRQNIGQKPIHAGISVKPEAMAGLDKFLEWFKS